MKFSKFGSTEVYISVGYNLWPGGSIYTIYRCIRLYEQISMETIVSNFL